MSGKKSDQLFKPKTSNLIAVQYFSGNDADFFVLHISKFEQLCVIAMICLVSFREIRRPGSGFRCSYPVEIRNPKGWKGSFGFEFRVT